MSEYLPEYAKESINWKLKFDSEVNARSVFAYLDPRELFEVAFTVKIQFPLFKIWQTFSKKNASDGSRLSLTELLNATVPGGCWAIATESSGRLEENLRKEMGKIVSLYKKCKGGRNRKELDKRYAEFSVLTKELVSITKLREEYDDISMELEEWKNKCIDLESEKNKLLEEIKQVSKSKDETIEVLDAINEELKAYVVTLEKNSEQNKNEFSCTSKKMSEVCAKQKSRKLKQIKDRAQCALWFSKSFGLDIKSIVFKDSSDNDHTYTLDYEENDHSCTKGTSRYEKLTEEEHSRLEQVLLLLDKFYVSDECYHELSLITEDFPRYYLIKQKRDDLNSVCHIERVPGPLPGAQRCFASMLKELVGKFLDSNPSHDITCPIKVKISGDGAKMSRTTTFMILSFSLLQSGDFGSSKGNHTIAIVNGPESYDTLDVSFREIIKDINNHVKSKPIEIEKNKVPLEFFLGGDLKFLLLSMGLSGATSDFACLWCKVHKSKRWDMAPNLDYYYSDKVKRTLKSIKECCTKSKENYCCINPPLFDIELDNVVLDELHMMLRVTDRLLENLIIEVMEKDSKEDFNKKRGEAKGLHLIKLIEAINNIGITFSIWEKLNADGKSSGHKEWTSLVGSDKKKLMLFLPEKLKSMDVLFHNTNNDVIKLWEDFHALYVLICNSDTDEQKAKVIHNNAKQWINSFCNLGSKRIGYGKARVTPYMHTIPYHIPKFIINHGSIMQFSRQGVEKNNDDAKRIYYQKSNKWDAAHDILLLEARQKKLEHYEREKRKYTKRNTDWWDDKILQSRKRRKDTEDTSTCTATNTSSE